MTNAPDGQLRIGYAERDAAVAQLRDAAAEGRLTLDELEGRIGSALAARTRDELRLLLADLLPQWLAEGYQVVITSDHGMNADLSHGGTLAEERAVPL